MTTINLSTVIHVCEDTERNFDMLDLLAQAGYTASGSLNITTLTVTLPDGTISRTSTPLFGLVDSDTVYVHPAAWAANYNGKFSTAEFVFDSGDGNTLSFRMQVIIDPVNDAPLGADKTFNLLDGNGVTLSEADFGFNDPVEHNAFQSVHITTMPLAGQLLLGGVALAAGAEVAIADIRAGNLVFVPDAGTSGSFALGFQVRDDGGVAGCNASDLSATPNYLTFNVPMAHIGDRVWEDSNGNGVQDAGEAGIAGITVQLKDVDGHVVSTTTTDASGAYHFDVNAGTYSVAVVAPAGYVATVRNAGADTGADSDIDASGNSAQVSLAVGTSNNTVDAGLYRGAELGDRVWLDTNGNGVQDAGEAGLAGVKVTLLDAAGHAVGSPLLTDANGNYLFANLAPGSYSVQFDKTTLPAGYVLTAAHQGSDASADSDASVIDGSTAQVLLASGESNHSLDAGVVALKATLGDRVWEDSNGNGVQDAGEAGIAGVTVQLKDINGAVVNSTTTDASGNYNFTVEHGTYSVAVVAPAGYVATVKDAGASDAADSDIDASGNSAQVSLAAGASNNTLDAGLYRGAELGDRVWLDTNGNGVQDAGEAGLAGVKVTLLDAAGHAVGSPLLTDANGNYLFTNLAPGSYSVQFDKTTLPAGYALTAAHQGSDASADSDASVIDGTTAQVVLASGESNHSLDAGVVALKASLGDRVWEDSNGNGVQDAGEAGIAGVTVQLKDINGAVVNSATTDASGAYHFDVNAGTYSVAVAAPAGYVATARDAGASDAADSDIDASGNSAQVTVAAGQVYRDLDAGLLRMAEIGDRVWLDKNGNGVQDAGESGLACVTVQLKDASGAVVGTTTTDINGNYKFSVAPGTYSIAVKAPSGYVATQKDAGGNDATDSDIDAYGNSATVTVASGEKNTTLDAGLYQKAQLGDHVWHDDNGNGVQDYCETGFACVKVNLLDSTGKIVATTTTDSCGDYLFTNLAPGNYSVAFVAPTGYAFTRQDVGTNDAVDSDANALGQTGQIALSSGQSDRSVDAGLVKVVTTIGDRVWEDKNGNGVQDSGESGLSCVTVQLKNALGTVIATTTTDLNGNYKFDVQPGTYSIAVKAPCGYVATQRDAGGNDATDSDIDAYGNSSSVTVAAGDKITTLDAGLYRKAELGSHVWHDDNGNGVQDWYESGFACVKVNLLDSTGKIVATTTTDACGDYLFTNLAPGSYSVAFIAPTGYAFTKQDAGYYDSADSDANAQGQTAQIVLSSGQGKYDVDAGLVKALGSIGDRVWEDKNFNGVQDAGETGICGVTVKLLDAYNQVLATTTTNANGNYVFTGLNAGDYKVEVVKPCNYYATKSNIGADTADSDIGTSSSRTDLINLSWGENDMSVDAGLYRKASIGDKVWRDSNHNGVQDLGEEGIGGVKVMLYNDANQLLASTTTDCYGNYKFANLDPNSYYLQFDKSNVLFKGYNMNDWKWGVKNVGSDDQIDSDVNGDGISKVNVTRTDSTFLESGENDMSWDATITPIVIDLNGDGVHTIARADFKGSFDLLGNGHAIQSGWVSSNDGFLAVDSNGNGRIDGIGELFGGASKGSGFAKLASFDSNHDGVVDAHDDQFANLRIWRDANSNGATDAGELLSLHDAGVTSLTVGFTELPFLDENNNLHLERSTATLASGKAVGMTDVYFNVDAKDAAKAGVALPSMADLLRDDHALDQVLGGTPAPVVQVAQGAEVHAQCDAAEVLRRIHAAVVASEVAA